MTEHSSPNDDAYPSCAAHCLCRLPVCGSSHLQGWWLVVSAAYVFVVPLVVVLATVWGLGPMLGELAALGAGLVAAGLAMLPACRILRGRPREEHSTCP